MQAGVLEIQLAADIARLRKDMGDAQRVVGDAMSKVSGAVGVATRALGLLGVGLSAASFVAFVRNAIDAADAANKLAQRTGIATEALSQLQYAAKLADISNETLGTGIKKLNQSIAQGLAGDKEKLALFRQLGVTTEDLGRGTVDVMMKMADAYATSRDGAGKTAVSLALMGKAGDEMIPLLNAGGQAIRDLMLEADRLGLTIGGEFAERAEEFNDNLTRMQTGSQKLAIALASDLIESLGKAAKAMAEASMEGGKFAGVMAGLQTLLTGDDRHKANVEMVRIANEILKMQDAIDKARERGDEATATRRESLLAGLRREYEMHRQFGQALDQQAASAKEAADKIKKLREEGTTLKGVTAANTDAQKALNKAMQEAMRIAQDRQKARIKEDEEIAQFRREQEEAAIKAAKLQQELIDKRSREYTAALQAEVIAATAGAAAAEDQARTYGMSREQLHSLTLARIEEQREQRLMIALTEEEVAWINQIYDARRRIASAQFDKSAAEANSLAAETAKREWQSVADSFVDNLMRGGKSVAQYLKDLFRTLVLRPLLQPIGNALSNMVGGGQGGNAAMAGSWMTGFGNSAAASFLGYASAINSASNGQYGAAIGTALGTYVAGPLGAMIGNAIGSAIDKAFAGETRSGGQYRNSELLSGPSGGQIGGATEAITATMTSINQTLRALGSSAQLATLVSGLEQSERGRGFAYAGGMLTNNVVFGQGVDGMGYMNRRGSMTSEQASAAFSEELKQATLQALQAADVPGILGDYLRSLGDIDALSGGELDAALQRINKALTEKQSLEDRLFMLTSTELEQLARARELERAAIDESNLALLDQVYAQEDLKRATEELSTAQEEAAEAAAQAAQSLMDKLTAALPFFMSLDEYQNYQAGQIADQFNAATGANITPELVLGLTPEDFRAFFEGFVEEGNQAAVTAMIELAQAFISLTNDVEAASATLRNLQAEGRNLDVQLLDAMGDTTGARALLRTIETTGMTPEEIAQYDANQAKRDQIDQILKDTKDAAEAERLLAERRREQIQAARQLRETWQQLAESMLEEVYRLKGGIAAVTPQGGLAFQLSEFAIALAQAQSGDVKAAGRITGLTQAVEQAAMQSVGSLAELNSIRAYLAGSLEGLATDASDGSVVSELRASREIQREQRDEIRSMRQEIREANAKIERHQRDMNDRFDKWDVNGGTDAGLIVTTVAG